MKKTKSALFNSMIALLLCAAMLLGTTFAWFTDEVTSTGNIIKTGTLDVKMTWSDKVDGTYKDASEGAIFNYRHWEPGYVDVKYVKIENVGSLAFQFRLDVIPASEARDGEVNLADVIDVYIFDATATVDRAAIDAAEPVGTMSELMADVDGAAYGVLLPETGVAAPNAELNAADANFAVTGSVTYCIVLKMQEDAGNEYQDKTLGNGFAVQLLATQYGYEQDSFGNDYDNNATFPGDFAASAPVTVANGAVSEPATVGEEDGINAAVPTGVKVADGATELALTVNKLRSSEANIELERGETKTSLDIHMEGVAEDNTVPMLISLPGLMKTGLNSTSVAMYHVEDGVTVAMTLVSNPANHNEFSYDPATGDVVLCVATFSEYVAVTHNWNIWKGTFDTTSWYDADAEKLYINNAEQLAGFGAIVDGGYHDANKVWVAVTPDDFSGQTIYLSDNIDLGGKVSFNPIGCGYVNGTNNSNSVTGRAFEGTFDGQNHAILNLYQNGWDLGLSYCTLGGGLFASVCDATIKNLTMVNANIVMECVEQGVIAGLAQGDCTFENITIYGCSVANYQRATGGVVGEVSWGKDTAEDAVFTHTFTNINVDSTTVVGSLWGDFDAPVGGVIGGYWDDSSRTRVVMDKVNVACRLDVYNDVTSTYQWYSYRRAGMLIGNTDRASTTDGRTTASTVLANGENYLTCSNVTVRYGDWRNYHYCEFSEYNPSWPFVRVEAGENCTAFSNPRWGVPEYQGVKVTPENHPITEQTTHTNGDDCMVLLEFNQLYGGGQGVYGAPDHDGVTTSSYAYTIQYVNDNKLLAETFVESNEEEFTIGKENTDKVNYDVAVEAVKTWLKSQGYNENEIEFGGWVNAGSTKVTKILAGTTGTVKLYPYFKSPYTARFVDQNGNVLAWCLFHSEKLEDLEPTKTAAEAALPNPGEHFKFDYWRVHITNENGVTTSETDYDDFNFAEATSDVTIYPVYKFDGDVKLIPVDSDGDGATNYYQVAGYSNPSGQALVEIPASVNGIPILEINGGAFSSYDGVHSILIPADITYIGDNAFAEKWGTIDSGETITIYYAGSYSEWMAKESKFGSNWESGISSSTRIFFLNGGNAVDISQGYLQAEVKSDWGTRTVTWNHVTTISQSIVDEYTGHCDCSISTTGDTAHIYVDSDENIMGRNGDGTPINSNGVIIEYKRKNIISSYKLTTDHNDTYYRYRPDKAYWEGVTAN